ncbi:CLUMA_CG000697, isoform A [Clunio marinus]|uniref:CLUMA_CG000697, isoform A n=1 Tax=Clunio marinus TaxID=568069 RepID=A0A1J1HFU9_9DIPT|nr:CLUMA_CG000697, isoform A [Clunio marinus]
MMDYSPTWSDFDSISTYSNEGLETYQQSPVKLRPKEQLSVPKSERTNSYRFSMANLEETQESELDSILTELSLLEQKGDLRQGRTQTHSRSSSIVSGANSTISSTVTASDVRESSRTESPDNDSAFSDTVSLLSSESSASSGLSSLNNINKIPPQNNVVQDAKSTKIQLALQKLEHASVRRLFVKAFSDDGSSKSLLVDERMNCGFVTKLLADKNHVNMEVSWGLIEYLPELYIERLYEDHELLVENLLTWSNDSKNRVLFLKRPDRVALFMTPEKYLPSFEMAPGTQHDEDSRNLLLEEFFANNNPISLEGPLYLKSESKKGWKRYHFVLRQSGLYYYPKEKEKVKSSKDLMCLALFNSHNVYKGVGWKKKYKAPTDHSFALKCPKVNITGKGMKMLCAEDSESLQKWIMCCRIAKYGKKLVDNFKNLVEDLAREDLDKIASTRLSFTPITTQMNADKISVNSSNSNGRLSRASTSSSSSGCLSDDNNGFESEFTTGTIKRKPTIKPNLPLTTKTRQLIKEVEDSSTRNDNDSLEKGGTLTRRRSHSSSSNGTLKRQGSQRTSIDSMKSANSPVTPEESFIKSPTIDAVDSTNLMSNCMTDSMLSLPPPPEPSTCVMSASTLSLNSLPFPDPPDESVLKELTMTDHSLVESQTTIKFNDESKAVKNINYTMPTTNGNVESEPIYKTILKPPPYKSPPPVKNKYSQPPPVPQKSVTFADSSPPVVLRKKVCFDEKVEKIIVSPRQEKAPPLPPLRDRSTFLSCTSPKRLCDSACNPPQDFWKDLQRVVNKKLGVAQKCKMNLQMSPGEVLGFRDPEPTYESNYYRETSTSNWVLEHYGDNLYENWDGNKVNGTTVHQQNNNVVMRDVSAIPKQILPLSPQRRSTRGPPVPIRNSSTRLSTNSNPTAAAEMQ